MAPRLQDKTVVVTGAGHGIGRAYSVRIAQEGASVLCLDVDQAAVERVAREISEAGGSAIPVGADVSRLDQVTAAARLCEERFGGIDGLVNNAGLMNVVPVSRVMFEQIPDAEWDRVFDVNIKGMWYCCKAFVPLMRRRGGGSIVNIASSTVFKANATRAHYVASKGAVFAFSRVLSRELGGDWIRVNVVCPGSTLSEEDPSPEVIRMREEPIASRSLKRVQRPDDMVGTIIYLLSEDSAFVTGQTIVVEGGGVLH